MKMTELQLIAFGPFTDRRVTFGEGPAQLHILHGANEAGKSSALRAMTDLRYGIPLRTRDVFVHAHERLLLGGVFVDAGGQRLELRRSKSRSKPLFHAQGEQAVAPAVELALKGGIERADFEAMFGLDHERLRAGGRQLLRGDGELGAALFEASAGARGIKTLLTALEADAKQLWNPRGNAKTATMNEAARQFDDARRAWREALVRPADWQQRQRAHADAQAELARLTQALQAARLRLAEARELRTVAPLLRQVDQWSEELRALEGVRLLHEEARDERLAAEPGLVRARLDMNEAQALVEQAMRALADLPLADPVLACADLVERLLAQRDTAARGRAELARVQAAFQTKDAELALAARRIAGKGALPHDALAAAPSPAERPVLLQHVGRIEDVAVQLRTLRQQLVQASEELYAATEARVETMPDAGLRAAVQEALGRAYALGDVEQRLREIDRQRRELAQQTASLMHDLEDAVVVARALDDAIVPGGAAPSVPDGSAARREPSDVMTLPLEFADRLRAYREAKPLLAADIEAERMANGVRDELGRKLALDLQALERELDAQQERLHTLVAEGEVVTADMLRETRGRRDNTWAEVREAWLGARPHGGSADVNGRQEPALLARRFTSEQAEADRQADMLRADAQRAAVYEECRVRIEQLSKRRRELQSMRDRLAVEAADASRAWQEQLRKAGLPVRLTPMALAEWQGLRAQLLDRADRLAGLLADREQVVAGLHQVSDALAQALEGFPSVEGGREAVAPSSRHSGDTAEMLVALGRLVRRASDWEAEATRVVAEQGARNESLAALRQRVARLRGGVADAEAQWVEDRAALASWLKRAFLEPDAQTEMVRARLDELQALQALATECGQLAQRRDEIRALLDEARALAVHVATRLGDEVPDDGLFDAYADRLQGRLAEARAVDQSRREWLRERERGESGMRQAQAVVARHEATLRRLCEAAGVAQASELAAVEEASARRRQALASHADKRSLLAQASARGEAELRERLSGQDLPSLDLSIAQGEQALEDLESELAVAREKERAARAALDEIDSSDMAAQQRDRMEQAAARWRSTVMPWARLRVAHTLLQESLRRFRERAQAPMMQVASRYFSLMTAGRYPRLAATEEEPPSLIAERHDGELLPVDALSEGTADQLYLALRLAALELRAASHPAMPLVLDDVLITSDEQRAVQVLGALAAFSRHAQVFVFTHHRHVVELGQAHLPESVLSVHTL